MYTYQGNSNVNNMTLNDIPVKGISVVVFTNVLTVEISILGFRALVVPAFVVSGIIVGIGFVTSPDFVDSL